MAPLPHNQIMPDGLFEGNSSYNNQFEGKAGAKRDKVSYPDHDVLPHGAFEGASNYQQNYLKN